MADHTDDYARPAKRARLDDNSAPSVIADDSAPTPQAAPKAPTSTAIDADLEREVRAGITEYVCPDNLGFTGVLKQRYTDFLVNEIGLNGEVVHLKSTEVQRKEKKQNGKDGNSVVKDDVDGTGPVTKIVEELGDAGAKEVQNVTTAAQTEAVKVEGEPKQTTTVAAPSSAEQGEVKVEVEEEVSKVQAQTCTEMLIARSSSKTTATYFTQFSAKTRPDRFLRLSDKYEGANTRRQKISRLSSHRPSSTRNSAPKRIKISVGYSPTSWRAPWRKISQYESRPHPRLSARARAKPQAELGSVETQTQEGNEARRVGKSSVVTTCTLHSTRKTRIPWKLSDF